MGWTTGIRRAAVAALLAAAVLVTTPVGPVSADGNEAPGAPVAFRSISVGLHHTCVLQDDGAVACWGDGGSGQLGNGAQSTIGDGPNEMGANLPSTTVGGTSSIGTATALATGAEHTCALRTNGTVTCWGDNSFGQLGRGSTTDALHGAGSSVDLGTARTAVAIAAGDYTSCAILDTGAVKCWGRNGNGQLGQSSTTTIGDGPGELGDDLPAIDLGTGRTATAISASANETCALLDDHSVKCWGSNGFGQLGQGDTSSRLAPPFNPVDLGTGRTATAISTGLTHTCALLDNGTVKCWGSNGLGQLGQGSTTTLGDGAGEMGNALPPVDVGTSRTVLGVTTGENDTCAVLDDHTVKCWGSGQGGRLGYGDTTDRGDGTGEMGDALPIVELGTGRTATAVSADGHTCAVLDDATVKCWGPNGNGQLGQGDTASRGDAFGEMGNALPAIALPTDRTVGPVGELEVVTFAVSPTSVAYGEVLSLQLSVFNVGGTPLTDVRVEAVQGPAGCDDDLRDLLPGDGDGFDCQYTPTQAELGDVPIQYEVTTAEGTSVLTEVKTVHVVEPAPELTVTLEPDVTTVDAGGTIHYDLRVKNTGNVRLTDLDVVPSAAGCGDSPPAELARGETYQSFCEHIATNGDAPTYGQSATASADGVDPVVGSAPVTVRTIRGDALIKVGNGANVGNNVRNTTGANQTRSATVGNRGTARFTVTAQNDGTAPTNLRLRGAGGTNRFTVTYKVGAANVTNQVVAGTYSFNAVAPGASRALTVVVTAKAGTPVRAALSRLVTVTDGLGAKDTVKLTVTRR